MSKGKHLRQQHRKTGYGPCDPKLWVGEELKLHPQSSYSDFSGSQTGGAGGYFTIKIPNNQFFIHTVLVQNHKLNQKKKPTPKSPQSAAVPTSLPPRTRACTPPRFGCIFLTIFNNKVARAARSWRRENSLTKDAPHKSEQSKSLKQTATPLNERQGKRSRAEQMPANTILQTGYFLKTQS